MSTADIQEQIERLEHDLVATRQGLQVLRAELDRRLHQVIDLASQPKCPHGISLRSNCVMCLAGQGKPCLD